MFAVKVTGSNRDEDNDSDKNAKIVRGEMQGSVAMEMTRCQLLHPIVVAGTVIGFEMKEGGMLRRGRW